MIQGKYVNSHGFNLTTTGDEPLLVCWYDGYRIKKAKLTVSFVLIHTSKKHTRGKWMYQFLDGMQCSSSAITRRTISTSSVTPFAQGRERLRIQTRQFRKRKFLPTLSSSIYFLEFHLDSETVVALSSALSNATTDFVGVHKVVFPEGDTYEQTLAIARFA